MNRFSILTFKKQSNFRKLSLSIYSSTGIYHGGQSARLLQPSLRCPPPTVLCLATHAKTSEEDGTGMFSSLEILGPLPFLLSPGASISPREPLTRGKTNGQKGSAWNYYIVAQTGSESVSTKVKTTAHNTDSDSQSFLFIQNTMPHNQQQLGSPVNLEQRR